MHNWKLSAIKQILLNETRCIYVFYLSVLSDHVGPFTATTLRDNITGDDVSKFYNDLECHLRSEGIDVEAFLTPHFAARSFEWEDYVRLEGICTAVAGICTAGRIMCGWGRILFGCGRIMCGCISIMYG